MKVAYHWFQKYCLRTPLYPFTFYQNLTANERITPEQLEELFLNPILNEALFLATPALHKQLTTIFKAHSTEVKKKTRLYHAFLKYLTRMSTRCTPFGLFSGCSLGVIDHKTTVELLSAKKHKRVTRFDYAFLAELQLKLLHDTDLKKELLFYPNTSLYKIGRQYRYVEYSFQENQRIYTLEGIRSSTYLEHILEYATSGKTLDQLTLRISDKEVSKSDAIAFINQLIDAQILVSELELALTDSDTFLSIIQKIAALSKKKQLTERLSSLHKKLHDLDHNMGNEAVHYQKIKEQLKKEGFAFAEEKLFQSDMYVSTASNTLSQEHIKQVKQLLPFLNKMTLPTANKRLESFKRAFKTRFETEEIPLVQALDTEIGIGYASKSGDNHPLLEDIKIPTVAKRYERMFWTDFDNLLLKKMFPVKGVQSVTIHLEESDFKSFSDENWEDLPDTFSGLAELFQLDGKSMLYLRHLGGSSGANLIARFGQGDKETATYAKEITSVEQEMNPEKIMAEIVHLPQSRTGNILKRPAFRDFEIPYLGKSSLPSVQQLSIEDLMLSIRHDKLILRSKQHDKEVLPRLTNAHAYNHSNSLPIYHFLCDLQFENKRSGIGFHWNEVFQKMSFLPRVTFKNVILSKARWRIAIDEVRPFINGTSSLKVFLEWCKEKGISQYVELIEGDNHLLINTKNLTCIEMLLETVKNETYFILEEFLFDEGSPVHSKGQHFCNQFVFSFYNQAKLSRHAG